MINFSSLRLDAIDALGRIFQRFDFGMPSDQLIPLVDEVCLRFHVIAVAGLFEDGDSEKFFMNLCRAGENWRRLLVYCRSKRVMPPAASKLMPLLGVMAAGEWDIASGIAKNTASEFRAGEEYIEEYNVAMLVNLFAETPTIKADVAEERVRSIEEIDGGLNTNRIALCRSLLTRDRIAFQESFTELLAEHEVVTESRALSFSTPYTKFAPYRYIWFEGLTWLRIAERYEMSANRQFRYCPPLARLTMRNSYSGDWALPF